MSIISRIAEFSEDLVALRRDFHEHPELGMEEFRTSKIVAKLLSEWGIETHTEIGKTGVVGVLKGNKPGRSIGLRADMDALPMEERTNLPFASKNPGVMHACGHDAHTTMLLALLLRNNDCRVSASKKHTGSGAPDSIAPLLDDSTHF